MNKKKILLFIIIFAILLIAIPLISRAVKIPDPFGEKTLPDIIKSITGLLKIIAMPVAGIMIIIGGIQIMTGLATGEKEKKVLQGKNTLKWAIIGLAIIIAADFIVGIIKEILSKVE